MSTKQQSPQRNEPYWLGDRADSIYNKLKTKRQPVLDTARELATITLPHVFPPEGFNEGDTIGTNNQSVGADCVNTLASKLMYLMLPPSRAPIEFMLREYKLRQSNDPAASDPALISKLNVALANLEMIHKRRLDATTMRMMLVLLADHLLLGGNVCWEHTSLDYPVVHPMSTYVVKRDKDGRQRFVILEEKANVEDLPEELRAKAKQKHKDDWKDKMPWEQDVCVHKVCLRDKDNPSHHYTWQEWEGELIPETELTIDRDVPNLYAAWLIPSPGKDWGRSYCEQYRGDLYCVENCYSAIQDMGAAAALTLLFVRPGGTTNLRTVSGAANLKWLPGDAADITAFRLDKGQDAQFLMSLSERTERRLAKAFLTMTAFQRQGERVTAEEWRQIASEIDEAMGGLYSVLAQTTQRHLMTRAIELHREEDKSLPNVTNNDAIELAVVTGADALGRSHETEETMAAIKDVGMAMPNAIRRLSEDEVWRRRFSGAGVDTEGLLMPPEQVNQQDQSQQQQGVMAAAAPGVAQEAAKAAFGGMKDMALQQQAQQPPQPPQQ